MSTLSNIPVPADPGAAVPVRVSRAQRAAALPAAAFTAADMFDIAMAGGVFAAALADIDHHHIGDPGSWDCYGSAPDELARLHAALDQMAEAIRETRTWLAAVERRARRTVTRPDSGGGR